MSTPAENKPAKSGRFFDFLKNAFLVLLILQFLPSVISNFKSAFEYTFYPKAQVGYLHIGGVIRDTIFYTKRLEEFAKMPNIKALFLRIDSPGGLPGASQAIFNELVKFKKKKPIVVLIDNMCASGGYYIAAAANKIIANPTAIIGSIGVQAMVPCVEELLHAWHVKVNLIQSGSYKMAGNPTKEMSEEEKTHMQELSDTIYQQFTKDVAEQRGLEEKEIKNWADGKVFAGNKALELRLIDKVGSYSDAIDTLKEIANIKEEIKFVSLKKGQSGLLKMLMGDDEFGELGGDFSETASSFLSSVATKCYEHQVMSKATIAL